jgi:hypothetical protein
MANLSLTTLALQYQHDTGCTQTKAEAAALEYVVVCYKQILKHITKHEREFYYISQSDMRKILGDTVVAGKRYYTFNVFQASKHRIFSAVEIGNNINGKLTMARLQYDFDQMEQIITASGRANELVDYLYKTNEMSEVEKLSCEMIPIDVQSLRSFLAGNANIKRDGSARAKKADLYALHATRIIMIAGEYDNHMPHYVNESEFGRKYYRGPNLQNTPKVVRNAALGNSHEYDIENSVFAWKLSVVSQICNAMGENGFTAPATLEYLQYKVAKRRQLTETVFGNSEAGYIHYIKQAITAIGFGAPLRSGGYKTDGKYEPLALSECIKSTKLLDKFLNDSWVQAFTNEQKIMNDIIIEYVCMQGAGDHLMSIGELVNGRGKLKTNSVISYLYQQTERQILTKMCEFSNDRDVLLTVHDCFYTRRPINLREARYELKQIGEFFDISHEEHRAFSYDHDVEDHKRFIRSEEQRVARLNNKPVHDSVNDYNPVKAMLEFQDNYRGDWDCHDGKCYDGSNRNEAYSMASYDRDLDPWYDSEE